MLKAFFDKDEKDAPLIFKDTFIGSNALNFESFKQGFAEELASSARGFIKEGYGIMEDVHEAEKKWLIFNQIKSFSIEKSLKDLIRNISKNSKNKVDFYI